MARTPPLPLNTNLLPAGSRVCVALSGGADSTALLRALHAQAVALGIGLAACHLHHGMRGAAADGDEQFCRELCAQLRVPLTVEHADVPAQAAAAGETAEEAARNARLAFFDTLLTAGIADRVATAHTLDDQAETVLMKLIRGAWTEGLGGISPTLHRAAGVVVRPLLATSRAEIEAYLHALEQPWRTDATNFSLEPTRNRVRHQVVPLLRELNPQLDRTLAQLAEIARDEQEHWAALSVRLLEQLALPGRPVRGGGRSVCTHPEEASIAFEIERLRELDVATRRRVLRAAAARMGCTLSAAETQRVLLLCRLAAPGSARDRTVPAKPNSRVDLANGLRAERSVRELRLVRTS